MQTRRTRRGARGALMLMCIALHKSIPVHSVAMATAVHNADAPHPARCTQRAWRSDVNRNFIT
eukprot:4972551-Karenia_brevis.AAC.1